MNRQPSGHWPTAIVVLLTCFGVAYASAPRSDRDTKATFGLVKGASWTYNVTYGKESSEYSYEVARVIPDKNLTVFELISKTKYGSNYAYKAVGSNGLLDILNRSLGGPGYILNDPVPKLAAPYMKGRSWKWFSPFRGQVMIGPDGKAPDTTVWDRNCVATIEDEETLTVKAGTFKCFRVRVEETSKAYGKQITTDWISLDAGLVKSHVAASGNAETSTWELANFTPGNTP